MLGAKFQTFKADIAIHSVQQKLTDRRLRAPAGWVRVRPDTMRPELLNPLFAEVETLKGVGAGLARPLGRLGLARLVDLLFHLPTGVVHRRSVRRVVESPIVDVEDDPRRPAGLAGEALGQDVSSAL